MAKIVTLGEIMLRLSPPGYQRIGQAVSFDICYGGAEANVASSLLCSDIMRYFYPQFLTIRSEMPQSDN